MIRSGGRLQGRWAALSAKSQRRLIVAGGALALTAIALWARLPDLDVYLNIDAGHGWMGRTRRFWHALEHGQWAKTFQKTHPGVTLMWLAGPWLEHGPGWSSMPGPAHVAAGATPVAIIGGLLAPITYWLWLKIAGWRHRWPALIAGLLIATEPYLVAHSRTMHLDQLLTAFAWVGLLATALTLRRGRWRWAVIAGLCFGLAVLTKISAGALALGGGLWCLGAWALHPEGWRARRRWIILPQAALMTAVAVAAVWALWPALWDQPEAVITRLLKEGEALVEKGHKTFFLGETTENPGALFYPVIAMYRVAPETLALIPLGLWAAARRRRRRCGTFVQIRRAPIPALMVGLILAHLPMALALTLGAKKMDRYLLPLMPLMCLLAGYGLWGLLRLAQRYTRRGKSLPWWAIPACVALLGLGRGGRLIAVHPYPIAWMARWPAAPAEAAIQIGWGEGMAEAGRWISADAGPRSRPKVWSGLHQVISPYLPGMRRAKFQEAEYLVRYVSLRQRGWWSGHFRRYGGALLHQVELEGRVYVEIWSGPGRTGRPLGDSSAGTASSPFGAGAWGYGQQPSAVALGRDGLRPWLQGLD